MNLRFRPLAVAVMLFVIVIAAVLAVGCSSTSSAHKEVNDGIVARDVVLDQKDADVVKAHGEGEVAPCVMGYERGYKDLGMVVGFHQDTERVRRVTVKDPTLSILGITPGASMGEATAALVADGFVAEGDSTSKFLRDDLRVTLTTFDSETIDEVTIEVRPRD